MADAGSLHSRRRVSTGGAEDPLPMVRLPEPDTPRTPLSLARLPRTECKHVNAMA